MQLWEMLLVCLLTPGWIVQVQAKLARLLCSIHKQRPCGSTGELSSSLGMGGGGGGGTLEVLGIYQRRTRIPVLSIRPGTCWSSSRYSVVALPGILWKLSSKLTKCDLKTWTPSGVPSVDFYLYKKILIKMIYIVLSYIYSSIHFIHFHQKKPILSLLEQTNSNFSNK